MTLGRGMALVAAGAVWTALGFAAPGEATPQDLSQLSLQELMEIEIPSVTTAALHTQKSDRAPASVTVITRDDLLRYGCRTVADAYRFVPGAYTGYDRNYTYLGLRGFMRPGDYNSRYLLLIDGHRANDAIFGTASLGTEDQLDIENVERIEVVRGPGSSLYGTSAMLGVINVVTRDRKSTGDVEAAIQAGSFGARGARVAVGLGPEGGSQFVASVSDWRVDGQPLYYPEYDTPETNAGLADNDDDHATRAMLKGTFGATRVALVANRREKGIPTGAFSTVFGDTRSRTLDEQFLGSIDHGAELGGGWTLDASLQWNHMHERGDYALPTDEGGTVINRDLIDGDAWTASLRLTGKAGVHALTAGAEYRLESRLDQVNADVDPPAVYLDDERTGSAFGLFLQDEVSLGPTVDLSAGVRFDHYNTFGSTTNPRLALIWSPGAGTSFKALFGTAFRAPSPFELYYISDGFLYRRNPDLGPEKVVSTELAWEQSLGRGLRISTSLFRFRMVDLINAVMVDNALMYTNQGSALSEGVEVEARFVGLLGFDGTASYVYAAASDEDTGLHLTDSPRNVAQLRLHRPLFGEALDLGVAWHYTGPRLTIQGTTTGSASVTSLTLRAPRLFGHAALEASAYNLFDQRYADPAGPEHVQSAIEQDGRTFRAVLTLSF